MSKSCKRILSWLMVLCMVLPLFPAADAAQVTWRETDQKITAQLSDRLVREDAAQTRDDSEMVRVSIVLEAPSTVEAGYATMGIASNTEDEAVIRSDFEALRSVFDELKPLFGEEFDTLSMGMSDDYPIAIDCGSTSVRVGSMIFGARDYGEQR